MSEERVGIRITVDGVVETTNGVKLSREEVGKLGDELQKASGSADKFAQAGQGASASWKQFLGAMAGYDVISRAAGAIKDYIQQSVMLAARHEELGVVMRVVGNNAGYTATQMAGYAAEVQKAGISMLESRNTVIQLAQAQIGLADASKLARVAQDVAVLGMTNSSDALQRMVYGIKSGQTEVLRTLGINVNFEQSYRALAAQMHTTTDALNEQQKMQARENAVMEEGTKLIGVYEEAMGTAGKQMRSMARYTEDLKVLRGEIFNEALTVAVMGFVGHLHDANKEISELAKNGELKQWGNDLADALAEVADYMVTTTRTMMAMWASAKVVWKDIKNLGAEAVSRPMPQAGLPGLLGMGISGLSGLTAQERTAIAERTAALEAANAKWEKLLTGSTTPFQDALAKRREAHKEDADRSKVIEQNYLAGVAAIREAFSAKQISLEQYTQSQLALARAAYPTEFPAQPKAEENKAKEKKSQYDSLIQSIREKIAVGQLELQTEDKLSEGQKVAMKVMVDLRDGKLKATAAQRIYVAGLLEELIAGDRAIVTRELEKKQREEALAISAKLTKEARDLVEGIDRETTSIEQQAAAYGLSKDAVIELEIARLEERKLFLSQAEGYETEIAAIDKLIAAKRRLVGAVRGKEFSDAQIKAAQDAAKQAAEDWKRTAESIDRGLTDALMRGFDAGKSFARNFRDSLRDMFKTLILRPVISFILSPVSGALTAILTGMGISGTANATGGANATGVGGWLSAGQTMYNGVVSGFSGLGETAAGMYTGAVNLATGNAYVAPSLVNTASVEGVVGGQVAAPGATGLGTAASYAGAGIAGIAIGSAIAGDKEVVGLDGTTIAAIGAVIGSFWGPVGTFVGAVIGGVVDAAFGMGPKKSDAARLQGTFSGTGFSGAYGAPWHQEGGWFRSDRSGTDITALTQQQSAAFAAIMVGTEGVFSKLVASAGELPRALGDWAFAVDQEVNTAEQQKQLVIDIATSMGTVLVPELAALKKEGENLADTAVRMTDEFALTDRLANLLGKDISTAFGSVGLASAAMRDQLVTAMGGIQAMTASVQSYYQAYFTDAERQALDLQALTAQFSVLHIALPAGKEAFRSLVESLDLTSAAGQKTFAQLMALAPAFAQVTDAQAQAAQAQAEAASQVADAQAGAARQTVEAWRTADEEVARRIDAQRQSVIAAYERESGALNDVRDKMLGFVQTLKQTRDSLQIGDLSPLSPWEQYQQAKAHFEELSGALDSTNATEREHALSELATFAPQFLQISRSYNASSVAFAADWKRVQDVLGKAADYAQTQADVATQQLSVMDEQLTTLGLINQGTQSLVDLLTAYLAMQPAAGGGGGKTAGGTPTEQWFAGPGGQQMWVSEGGAVGLKDASGGLMIVGKGGNTFTGSEALAWINAKLAEGPAGERELYNKLLSEGISSASFEALKGLAPGTGNAWADLNKLPHFAEGGVGGGWTVVGERGWELAHLPPRTRVYSAEESRSMLARSAANDDRELVDLLREVLTELRAANTQRGAVGTAQLTRLDAVIDKVDAQRRTMARQA